MDCLAKYYRCPDWHLHTSSTGELSSPRGYFGFGPGITCYGRCSKHAPARFPTETLHDAMGDVEIKNGTAYLSFDPSEVIDNLHRELYVEDWRQGGMSTVARLYYFVRPILGVGVRRHLQKLHFRGWESVPFPRWPVDSTVDNVLERLMLLALKASGVERIPFIWFWPDAAPGAAIMTHDVETISGRDFCATLMDIDDSFGIKSSFQVIPEERYTVEPSFLSSIRNRGFEIVLHDLNHDGHLFRTRQEFLSRAARINSYGKQYGAEGFRAGVLYRKQVWYDALHFAYDMSVPNVAHLDPQHGGCCTVMPYFIGNILELPVTATQDYTLFHILNDYSTDLWKRQIDLIIEKHGLMSFIVHPDYILRAREQHVYRQLLGHLRELRKEEGVWLATPGEVNHWWRQRDKMTLIKDPDGWHIEGAGSERACVAYAREKDGRLSVSVEASSIAR